MGFVKRTWQDRISQYPNRRTINDGSTTKVVTVGRDEGNITQPGDAFTAANMNDLEQRIETAFEQGGGGGGGGSSWTDLIATLQAGYTSITLSDASIQTTSTIDIYVSTFGIQPTNAVVATGTITLTFLAQASDITVKVRVS